MVTFSREEPDRQRRLVGVLIFGALAALPYLMMRRRLNTAYADLRTANRRLNNSTRETEKLRSALATMREGTAKQNTTLHSDVKTLVEEMSKGRAQMGKISSALEEVKVVVGDLRSGKEEAETRRVEDQQAHARMLHSLEDLTAAMEAMQNAAERADQMSAEREDARLLQLSAFLRENYNERNRTFAAALKDVGRSLADVAAFMHEVEVRQGYVPSFDDKRGIERARQLAKKLEELSSTLPSNACSRIVEHPQTTLVSQKTHEPSDLLSH